MSREEYEQKRERELSSPRRSFNPRYHTNEWERRGSSFEDTLRSLTPEYRPRQKFIRSPRSDSESFKRIQIEKMKNDLEAQKLDIEEKRAEIEERNLKNKKEEAELVQYLTKRVGELTHKLMEAQSRMDKMLKFSIEPSGEGFPVGIYIIGNESSLQEYIYRFERQRKKAKKRGIKPDIIQLIQVPSEMFLSKEAGKQILAYVEDNFLIKDENKKQCGEPKISTNITDAIALGSYTFKSLKDKALWILLACRKVGERIEIGYFGGNRNCEEFTIETFGFKALKRETLSSFHVQKVADVDYQRLERLKYHDCQMPLYARDYCSTHTIFFWFV